MLGEAGREPRPVRTTESLAQYLAPGYLVFARDGTLLAQRFDADSARVSGDPIAIAEPVAEFASPGWAAFAVSATGAIAYQSPGGRARLVWFDRAGHRQPLENLASRALGPRLARRPPRALQPGRSYAPATSTSGRSRSRAAARPASPPTSAPRPPGC